MVKFFGILLIAAATIVWSNYSAPSITDNLADISKIDHANCICAVCDGKKCECKNCDCGCDQEKSNGCICKDCCLAKE